MTSIHLKSQGLAEYVQLMKFKKAERYFEEYSYSKAVELYKELYISGDSSLTSTIANCYFKLGLTDSASGWYSKVVKYTSPPVEDIYNYSEVLSQQGLYIESAKWLKAYRNLNTEDSRPNRKLKGNANPASLLENVNAFEITPLEINTHEAEFAAVPWNDRVIFTSSRRKTEVVKREYNWDQNPFLDLYSAKRNEDGSLSDVQKLDMSIKTPFHQGPASFTGDGQSVWFTRNNPNSKKGKGRNDILHLTLYSARMTSTKLKDIQPFPYNDAAYSVGQASVSEDGETLYFVSDMPGGYGGTDIYRTTMNDSGDWSTPENLGEFINTEGNEMFPYIHDSGFLFFSSNGHKGLGGLDVYKVHLEKLPQVIDNLNAPINSSKDDFAFVIDKEFNKGYFSSNRSGGVGSDDIYAFTLGHPFMDPRGLREVLSDNDSDEIMSMTPITIRDEGAHMMSEITTDFAKPLLLDSDTVSLSQEYMIQNTYSLQNNDLNTNEVSVTDSFNTEDLSNKAPKVKQSGSITDIKSSQVPEGLDSPKNIDESDNDSDEIMSMTPITIRDEGAHMMSEITTDFAKPLLLDSDTVSLSQEYMIQNTYSLQNNDLNTNEVSVTDSFNTEDLSNKAPKVKQSGSITDIKSSQVPEGLDSPKNIDESDNDSDEIMSMTPITIRDEGAHMMSEITTDFAKPLLLDSNNEASVTDSFKTEGLSIKPPKVQQSGSITDIKSSHVPEGLDSPKNIDESDNELLSKTTVALKDPIWTTEDTNEELIDPPLASHNDSNIRPLVNFEVGMDLGALLNINIIYFDFDKYEIRPDARIELEKVIAAMLRYPDLIIELGSHTDCRGSKAYNQKLSENRANATAEYLIKYIDNTDRVIIRGYGESQPVNNCKCETVIDTDCSEEQHQANRRTEFKLLSVNL